jgi:(2Fe-2S) ferredoxin
MLTAMRPVPSIPAVHLFVCANRREADSPLGEGCGDRGEVVYEVMKAEVAARGAYRSVWVTKTLCLGVCPRRGCTVAIYPRQAVVTEVELTDAVPLFERALAGVRP